MLIKFDSEIFNEIGKEREISFFISLFSDDNRYEFLTEYAEIIDSTVFNQLSEIDKLTLGEYYERYYNEKTKTINYQISLKSTREHLDVLNFEEAKIFFNQPFLLVLENSLNDGYFVDALIRNFKKYSYKIKKYKKNGWLTYLHGGGSSIRSVIEAKKKEFEHLPKDNFRYLRCFVLIDSDKKYPNQEDGKSKLDLFRYLVDNGIMYHQLYKREIENYLPIELLEKVPNNDDFISILKKFNNDMLDFFDIEKRFNNKNRASLSKEHADLYCILSDEDYNFIRNNEFMINNLKSDLPKMFEDISKPMLKEKVKHQSDPNELESLLKAITKEL